VWNSSNPRILAAGDVCRRPRLGLAAATHGRIAAENALFWRKRRGSRLVVPHCTRTDPQVVAVEDSRAVAKGGLSRVSLALGSSASASSEPHEFVHVDARGRAGSIARVLLVAHRAQDLFAPFALAMDAGLPLRTIAHRDTGNAGALLGRVAEEFARVNRAPGWLDWAARHLFGSRARA